jgi:general secretion pathway protein K
VANMTPQIYSALEPWVTVLPQPTAVLNIHTASAVLLRTINEDGDLQPLGEADAEDLIRQRCDSKFADVEDFLAQPAFSGKNMAKMEPLLGETSNYFLLAAQAEVAEREVRLYSVLERRGREVITLARVSGRLYAENDIVRREVCTTVQ